MKPQFKIGIITRLLSVSLAALVGVGNVGAAAPQSGGKIRSPQPPVAQKLKKAIVNNKGAAIAAGGLFAGIALLVPRVTAAYSRNTDRIDANRVTINDDANRCGSKEFFKTCKIDDSNETLKLQFFGLVKQILDEMLTRYPFTYQYTQGHNFFVALALCYFYKKTAIFPKTTKKKNKFLPYVRTSYVFPMCIARC